MEHYRTADAPPQRRTAYWNDLYAKRLAHVTFRPVRGAEFDAELRVESLGPVALADIRSSGADIERTPLHISQSRSQLFSFLMLESGSATLTHYGHESRLRAGDFTLCDNAAPHRIQLECQSRLIVIRMSPQLLKMRLPSPEPLCGLRLAENIGLTSTAGAMVRSLWRQLEDGLPDMHADRIASNLLDVMTTAYIVGFGDRMSNSSLVGLRKAQVLRFIERNLRDPELSQCVIAQGVRISSRYLRLLFAGESESVPAYILRRRLEECAKQMAQVEWRHQTITEIAFHWGFNSAAHFARSFRAKYGICPSAYRRQEIHVH